MHRDSIGCKGASNRPTRSSGERFRRHLRGERHRDVRAPRLVLDRSGAGKKLTLIFERVRAATIACRGVYRLDGALLHEPSRTCTCAMPGVNVDYHADRSACWRCDATFVLGSCVQFL
jgi:hypothetical protein